MLTEPTRQKLYALQLHGMAEAYEEQNQQSVSRELSFAARRLHFRPDDNYTSAWARDI
jgi:hypothetical protein